MKRQSRLTIAAAFDAAALALETNAPIPEPARLDPDARAIVAHWKGFFWQSVGARVTVPGSPWQVCPTPHALRIAAKRIRTGPTRGDALPRMPRCPVADALRLYGDETTAAAKIQAHCDAIQGEADPADITRWRRLAEWLTLRVDLRERVRLAEETRDAVIAEAEPVKRRFWAHPSPAHRAAYDVAVGQVRDAIAALDAAEKTASRHENSKPKPLR